MKSDIAREAAAASLAQRFMLAPGAETIAEVLLPEARQREVMRVRDFGVPCIDERAPALVPASAKITIFGRHTKSRVEAAEPNERVGVNGHVAAV